MKGALASSGGVAENLPNGPGRAVYSGRADYARSER